MRRDFSTDKTAEIAGSQGVSVISLPINLGIGGAMQAGYLFARENGYEVAIQVDGDGQHLPSEIKKLIQAAEKEKADMVIGSRFVSKTQYKGSLSRRFGISLFSFITKILIGQSIKDSTSGFRLVNRRVLEYFADNYPSDYPEPEVLVPLKKKGYKIIETPVAMKARSGGKSSISSVKSIYYMFKVTFAMLIAKIRKV